VPSGCMGNEIAVKVHTKPGQEVLTEDRGHILNYELGAAAIISGVTIRAVKSSDGSGHLTWDEIKPALKIDPPYYQAATGLICLENTHNFAGGSVMIHSTGGGNLAEYLASLERIRALAPARLLPAHGPVIDEPLPVLTRYIEHRMAREAQVLNALRTGRHTVQAIAESIYDGLDPALLPAAHETVRAHLDKLRLEGRAAVDADRWSVV